MKKQNVKIVNVNNDNVYYAINIQRSLFPDSNGAYNFIESLVKTSEFKFWLIKKDGQYIGTAGIYYLPEDKESAWLGWFGVLPEFRRQGIGSIAIKHFEKVARERGFRYTRLYTNRDDNETAKSFYRSHGYTEEYYECREDPGTAVEILSIFSKPLHEGDSVPLWGNKNMHIDEQLRKQKISAMFPSYDKKAEGLKAPRSALRNHGEK